MASTQDVISSFICPLDPDIENFLNEKAIKFENASKSRTYLLFDEEAALEGDLKLLAYFSIALHIITIPDGFSGNQIKKLDGFSSRMHGERITEFACYLIGQLGKNAAYSDNILTGDSVMEHALGVIGQASELAGGRIVIIECKPNDNLQAYYSRNGFKEYDDRPDPNGNPMIQMMRLIY